MTEHFLTCRGSRLDSDGRGFDHGNDGRLHRLDDDGFGLQCSDERFRLNGDFRAQMNRPQDRFNYKEKKSTTDYTTPTPTRPEKEQCTLEMPREK